MSSNQQKGRTLSKFLLILFILSAIVILFFFMKIKGNRIFPISAIKIASDYQKVSKTDLKKMIALQIQKENFLTLNITSLKQQLCRIPWVQEVSIRRVWPGTLLIKIEEQKPIALFKEKGVINQQGEIFYPSLSSIPQELPRIICNENDLKLVLQYYREMVMALQPLKININLLEHTFDGNIKVTLTNKVVLLVGKSDIIRRWKRFTITYPRLLQESFAKNQRIEQIDLRYPNGFSVRWVAN